MKDNKAFQYTTPYQSILKEKYPTPYRFSQELRSHVDMLFSHPYNEFNKIYYNQHKEYDSNDMLKPAWRIVKDYEANPQQYGNALEHIHENIIKAMWSTFLSLHKFRGTQLTEYMPMKLKWLDIGGGSLLDLLLRERPIMSADSFVKVREGKGLRDSHRAGLKEGEKAFEYLANLE